MTKRPTKPAKGRIRKIVAAPLRQSPSNAVESLARAPGREVEADVAILRELATLIDAALRQVSVTANATRVTL